jgi:hypothetical protein
MARPQRTTALAGIILEHNNFCASYSYPGCYLSLLDRPSGSLEITEGFLVFTKLLGML